LIKNPCNLNRLPGFSFGVGIDLNDVNDLARRFKSARNHAQVLARATNLTAGRVLGASRRRYFIGIRSPKSSSATVLLAANLL
jgi:hypothetical protein